MTELESMAARAREGALVLARPGLGALAARGEDRMRLLHNVLTNDVLGLSPGGGTRALLLDHKGRTLADLHLLVEEAQVRMVTEADRLSEVRDALDAYVIADDVELEVLDEAVVSLVGPAAEAAARAVGLALPARATRYAHVEGRLAERPVRVTRLPLQTLPSIDVIVPRDALAAAVEALAAGGAPSATGEQADEIAEVLRVESGRPRWGRELGPDVIPLEARQAEVLHPTKGCYVGQETIVRAQARGRLNWGLWGLLLPEGLPPPAAGTPVLDGDREVGRITSSAASPTFGRTLALARLRREVSEPGRRLRVGGEGAAGAEAVVADLPFVA